jgi:predicted DNA binding CopG/RHH family protein
VKEKLNPEEREILDLFERGELRPVADVERELEVARQAARNTFNKTRRVNLRVTERDFELAHSRAREEGIPYQTLLSSVIHKFLSGRLVEKAQADR